MECVYILGSVYVMKAGLMKIVHEVRKNAGIHSKVLVKTVPAVCVGGCARTCMCDEVINPRRACAARVTVVGLSVCLFVR